MKTYLLIVLSLLSGVTGIRAQQPAELKALINESFTYYPKIKELEQAEIISAERLKSTRSNQVPTVSGLVSYNYIDPVAQASIPVGPGISRTLQFQPNNNFNAAVTANYVLLDFGRLKAAVEKSKEELTYSKQTTAFNKAQLAAQVSAIYYYVIYLKRAVAIQDSVIAYYKQNKQLIESKLRNGDALTVDLYTIEASIDNELNRKTDLENVLQKQLNLLEYTSGKSFVSGTAFDFSVPETTVDAYAKTAESQNSEYAMLKSRMAQVQSDIRYSQRQLTPTLNATAAAGFRNGYQPDIFANRFNYLAGLSLAVPIYSGGKNKAQIRIAEQTLKQTSYSLQNLNNQYRKDIKQALVDIESNKTRLQHAESQIRSAQAIVELTRSRFKNGVATYLDVTYAGNGLQRAALNKLQFEYQLCVARIELARLTGTQYW